MRNGPLIVYWLTGRYLRISSIIRGSSAGEWSRISGIAPMAWGKLKIGPRNVNIGTSTWSPGRTPISQKSRERPGPPTPVHCSGTSVGSPVVPEVELIAVSCDSGTQSRPPYGSWCSSR